ncbi:AI-2E family transporter [Pradoshia eiseniae]|uniref:AI-2E family transporter n=1 Tax=Pradoshia eiseniae TaxID=2064768 RepID=A0A2S7MYD7_9BACI|nr:AI-2E family transporter [Pradoshia eiseniae]PQD94765.1 AI-2E family transporter [Pradoshia eiseniae]
MWINKPFFKYATGLILILIIIVLFGKIDYFIWPFQKFIITLFFPILIAGLLYYILRPIVQWLSRYMPLALSITLIYLLFGALGYVAVKTAGPMIISQVSHLVEVVPERAESIADTSKTIIEERSPDFLSVNKVKDYATDYLESFSKKISSNAITIFSTITSALTIIVIVPFIVFYFLKDGHKLKPYLLRHIPQSVEAEGAKILADVDKTLSTYIVGQFIIALADGAMMYIGYLIIGLENALIFAIFATLLTVIPFLGPFLGIIPALISSFLVSPFMALKVLILMIIVQQIEGHLITPQVMGKRLDIHPLTVIFLLLVAGSLYGFVGILIAIPAYSVLKVIFNNFVRFYKLRSNTK